MTDVIDKASGQVVDHPDDKIAADWQAGKVQLIGGQKYTLRRADGSYGMGTAEQIPAALKAGASFASRDEALADKAARQAQVTKEGEAEAMGGATGAGFFGALSQALPGADYIVPKAAQLEAKGLHAVGLLSDEQASDLTPEAIGSSYRSGRAAQEEIHPTATAIGEGVGAVAGTLAAPELGVAGKIEGLAEGGSAVARILARTAAHGVIGALQGAQYGVSKAISDDAIEDHDLTAQSILAQLGPNVLWGGALGAGLGALGSVASEGLRAARAPRAALTDALERGSGTADDLATVAGKTLDAAPAEGLGEKVKNLAARISAAASGKDPDAILNVWNNRAEIAEAEAVRDQAIRDVRTHGDAILSASKDVESVWARGMKRSYMASKLEGVDPLEAAKRARSLADHTVQTLVGMSDDAERFGGTAAIDNTLKFANETSRKLDAAIESGNVGEMYGLVDDLKKAVGKPTSRAARLIANAAGDEWTSGQIAARQQAWKDLYGTIQVGLEDEGTWKEMGATQARVNKAYSSLIDARQRFNASLVTDIGRDPGDPWSRAQGMDPGKIGGYVRGLINPEKDLTHAAVKEYLAGTQNLASAMKESFDLPAGKLASVDRIADSAKAFADTLGKAEKSLVLTNQYEELRRVAGGNSMAAAGVVGGLARGVAGGITGLALGRVAKAFTHPADTIMQLGRVEQMMRASDSRIVRGLRGFAAGNAERTAGVEASTYARKSAQVTRLITQPDALTGRIGKNLEGVRSHSPKLADALTGAGIAGLSFLRDKLPPSPPGDPLNPKQAATEPPRAQKEAWLRYYEAVRDPLSVVEDLKNKRLSVEGIETLRTVYPSLYSRVQATTLDEMATGKLKDLDGQQRMGLGVLLDLPLPELSPQYVAARQAAYAQPARGPGSGAPTAPKRKIDLTKTRPQTATERVESAVGG